MPMCFVEGCEEESLGRGFYGRKYCETHYPASELVVKVAHKRKKDPLILLQYCFEKNVAINSLGIPQDSKIDPQDLIIPGENFKGALFCPIDKKYIPYAITIHKPGYKRLACPLHPESMIRLY